MTINNYPTHTEVTVFTDNAPAMETFRAESHLLGLRFEVRLRSTVATCEILQKWLVDDHVRAHRSRTTLCMNAKVVSDLADNKS